MSDPAYATKERESGWSEVQVIAILVVFIYKEQYLKRWQIYPNRHKTFIKCCIDVRCYSKAIFSQKLMIVCCVSVLATTHLSQIWNICQSSYRSCSRALKMNRITKRALSSLPSGITQVRLRDVSMDTRSFFFIWNFFWAFLLCVWMLQGCKQFLSRLVLRTRVLAISCMPWL